MNKITKKMWKGVLILMLLSLTPTLSVYASADDALMCSSMTVIGNGYRGEQQRILMTVTNSGDEVYNGNLYVATCYNGQFVGQGIYQIHVGAHATIDTSVYVTIEYLGVFTVGVFSDAELTHKLGEVQIEVVEWNPYDVSVSFNLDNLFLADDGNRMYGQELDGNILLTNNETQLISREFGLDIYEDDKLVKTVPLCISLPASQTFTAYLAEWCLSVKKGHEYRLAVAYNSPSCTRIEVGEITFEAVRDFYYRRADGSIVPYDLKSGDVLMVPSDAGYLPLNEFEGEYTVDASEASPNCIYMVAPDYWPEGLGLKNVINGLHMDLDITDGIDWYNPGNVIFNHSLYKRSLNPDRKVHCVMLPFHPASYRLYDVNGNILDAEVAFTQFWGERDGVVNFTTQEDRLFVMAGYTPYVFSVPAEVCTIELETNMLLSMSPTLPGIRFGDYFCGGTFIGKTVHGCYVLNDEGTAFVYQDETVVDPFRIYIEAPHIYDELRISMDGVLVDTDMGVESHGVNDGTTTCINGATDTSDANDTAIYTVDGRRIPLLNGDGLTGLSHGVYIVKTNSVSKKVIVR